MQRIHALVVCCRSGSQIWSTLKANVPCRNHNWFHGISEPLQPVTIHVDPSNKPVESRTQACRVRFYLALIKLTRLLQGSVSVAEVPANEVTQGRSFDIGAILLWLPPNKRLGSFDISKLWSSGFLSLILPWNYGFGAFHRIDDIFEANIKKMFGETLGPRGINDHNCGFMQMIASNQAYAGKGYASALLKWQIEQHFKDFPGKPVVLDTTTEQGIRAYQRLGFELLAERPVDTGTDGGGFLLKKDANEATREAGRKMCVQRVMIRIPDASPQA